MKSILDKDFKYDPSHDTDITRIWEKAKKKLEEDKAKRDELRKKVEKIIPHIGRRQS